MDKRVQSSSRAIFDVHRDNQRFWRGSLLCGAPMNAQRSIGETYISAQRPRTVLGIRSRAFTIWCGAEGFRRGVRVCDGSSVWLRLMRLCSTGKGAPSAGGPARELEQIYDTDFGRHPDGSRSKNLGYVGFPTTQISIRVSQSESCPQWSKQHSKTAGNVMKLRCRIIQRGLQ
jgi:hypothetical protein